MKDLQYITHDLGARNDPKLLRLQMDMGGQGLAIFWCLVEMLWENDGRLPLDARPIAFSLRWATAEEVTQVIREYGLFENDGKVFWSRSALERIAQKKERLSVRENSARIAANARWGKTGNAEAMPTQCAGNAEAMPRDKDRNIDIQKERNTTMKRPTAADVFDVMFFLNLKNPAGEAARFLEYYDASGWTYADGTAVTDWEKAARAWKPLRAGKCFKDELLRWYRAVWQAARGRMPEAHGVLLEEFENIREVGGRVLVTYRTAEAARAAAKFITDNDLAGDAPLDFRVAN